MLQSPTAIDTFEDVLCTFCSIWDELDKDLCVERHGEDWLRLANYIYEVKVVQKRKFLLNLFIYLML